jgi:hypothetical protein
MSHSSRVKTSEWNHVTDQNIVTYTVTNCCSKVVNTKDSRCPKCSCKIKNKYK